MSTPRKLPLDAEVVAKGPEPVPPHCSTDPETAMISLAVDKGAPIETIERLVALREKMLARQAEIKFSEALNRVQDKIKRIAPDLENPQRHSKYASYAAIDRVIRPIYGPEGFSLSFTHAECPKPDHIRVICWLRLGAHKEQYQVDWPVDTKGPKGEPVMTATQATGASDSYAKRYLVKDIFNIAIGEDDTDGNTARRMETTELETALKEISEATTTESLKFLYTAAFGKAQEVSDTQAMAKIIAAKDKRKKEIF